MAHELGISNTVAKDLTFPTIQMVIVTRFDSFISNSDDGEDKFSS